MFNQTNTPNETQPTVRSIIREIEEKSKNGDYIYRGEPEHHEESPYYGRICSSLYRQYARIDADEFDIKVIQEEILTDAAVYSQETNVPFEILTKIQHYGGKTNLIDFTTDHLIAIFFACDRSDSLKEDGRLILVRKDEENKDQILRPRNPQNRVIAQKSVFVRHPNGFLSPDEVEIITIPAHLKQPLLSHLRKYHDISTQSIYNDLHGFIINQRFHESAYLEFHRGLTSQLRGDETDISEEKMAAFEKSVVHYSRALKMKPELPGAYINRGVAHLDKGDFDLALLDFNTVIELNPNNVDAYIIRGDAYLGKGNFELALSDFSKAIKLNPNDSDAYIYRGNAYLEHGDADLALADFNKLIELTPDDAEAYIIRSGAYLELDDLCSALVDFEQAIALDPENAAIYIIRGDAYVRKDDFELATENYKKAIELDPYDAEAYYSLGFLWMQKQNWEEAKLNLTAAKVLKSDIGKEFHNIYVSIMNFEKENDVKLPEEIAAMLTTE